MERWAGKRNAANNQEVPGLDSQITEPTPSRSGPAVALRPQGPQARRGAVSAQGAGSGPTMAMAMMQSSPLVLISSPPPVAGSFAVIQEESFFLGPVDDDVPQPTVESPPEPRASSIVPETPVALGVYLPSSPLLLTEGNLSILNGQGQAPRSSPPRASHASAAPSIHPSETNHRISRLVLRSQINALHASAAQAHLNVAEQRLSEAHTIANREASACKTWRHITQLLVLLCLAYMAWCVYNSCEFAYIEERKRGWYGLDS